MVIEELITTKNRWLLRLSYFSVHMLFLSLLYPLKVPSLKAHFLYDKCVFADQQDQRSSMCKKGRCEQSQKSAISLSLVMQFFRFRTLLSDGSDYVQSL